LYQASLININLMHRFNNNCWYLICSKVRWYYINYIKWIRYRYERNKKIISNPSTQRGLKEILGNER
jgi:hypothetical protein